MWGPMGDCVCLHEVLKITEESFEEPDEDGIDACFFDHIV